MNQASRDPWTSSQSPSAPAPAPADERHPPGAYLPYDSRPPVQPAAGEPPGPAPSFAIQGASPTSSRPQYSLATLAAASSGTPSEQRSAPNHTMPNTHLSQAHPPYPASNNPNQPFHHLSSRPSDNDRERDQDRDSREISSMMDDHARRQAADARDRELRERQQNSETPIHQPIALPPAGRTVHGPNGILSNQGPASISQMPSSLPAQPQPAFAPMAQHQAGQQQPAAASIFPYPPAGVTQQPILNDALSYLDQVKVQFHNQPEVYNRFLDIMKDFKSGAIDTPGVIDRVSYLFAGNPSLIQGFNTFLPPGYRIECGVESDPNCIRVTTPMGTTHQHLAQRPPSPSRMPPAGAPVNHSTDRHVLDRPPWPPQMAPQDGPFAPDGRNAMPVYAPQSGPGAMVDSPPEGLRDPQISQQLQMDARNMPNMRQTPQPNMMRAANLGAAAASVDALGAMSSAGLMNGNAAQMAGGPGAGDKGRAPVEFNHAINYVNKIKNRFATQPDIYKQFLEILQTYQRESKPIGDVYSQVTRLFDSAPDLLEDFKQFLPESASAANAQAMARKPAHVPEVFPMSEMREAPYSHPSQPTLQHPQSQSSSRLPPMGSFSTPSSKKRPRQDLPGQQPTAIMSDQPSSAGRNTVPSGPQSKKQRAAPPSSRTGPEHPEIANTGIAPSQTVPSSGYQRSEVLGHLSKIQKYLGKSQYSELMKLMNLVNQDIVSPDHFLTRANSFFPPNSEHLQVLRELVGPQNDVINMDVDNAVEHRDVMDKQTKLARCRMYGPSYRLLPRADSIATCSGRDELCKSVLNDEWMSHPTLSSEDTGFNPHRKTQFEESLHRIEEERHDYDSNIECLVRTIQLLEPIVRHLKSMESSRRPSYRPDPTLGGQSQKLYQRTIFKLYGRASGNIVVERLMSHCFLVAPTLLMRCKDALEKWKAAQRQWNEVWRQQTLNVFHKSLDPQGSQHQRNTVVHRQFQPKVLKAEIESEKLKQMTQTRTNGDDWQYNYPLDNKTVLEDTVKLVQLQCNSTEKGMDPKIATFLESVLDMKSQVANDGLSEHSEGASESMSTRSRANTRPTTLRQTASEKSAGMGGSGAISQANSPASNHSHDEANRDESEAMEDANLGPSETWANSPRASGPAAKMDKRTPRKENVVYCNGTLYAFFRLFCMLYERLEAVFDHEEQVKKMVDMQMKRKPARALRLLDKEPSDFWENVHGASEGPTFYKQLISKFRSIVDSNAAKKPSQAEVEEVLRRYYVPCGYRLYHFDKLLQQIDRLVIQMQDEKDKSGELIAGYVKEHKKASTSLAEMTKYRNSAARSLSLTQGAKDESEAYRIKLSFPSSQDGDVLATKTMSIQVFDRSTPTIGRDVGNRYGQYVASYVLVDKTESVNDIQQLPFKKSHEAPDFQGQSWAWAEFSGCESLLVEVLSDSYKVQLTGGEYMAHSLEETNEPANLSADYEEEMYSAGVTRVTELHDNRDMSIGQDASSEPVLNGEEFL